MGPVYPKITKHDILLLIYYAIQRYPIRSLNIQQIFEVLDKMLMSRSTDSSTTRFNHGMLYAVKNNICISIICRYNGTERLSSCEFVFDIIESVVRVVSDSYYSPCAQDSISRELNWSGISGAVDCKFVQLIEQYIDDIRSKVNLSIAYMYGHKIPECTPIITKKYHNEKSSPFLI